MEEVKEIQATDVSMLQQITKGEIDIQIETAKKHPRSIRKFLDEALTLATYNESVAEACMYSLPRGGKVIQGATVRLAEIIASAWGNCRAGARIVEETNEFIVAQGAFHDLEKNIAYSYEVRRRITDKTGKKLASDMIAVTANAACAIAMRNAVLKGIPKAFWSDIYEAAKKTAVGTSETLTVRRQKALEYIVKLGVTEKQVFETLGVRAIDDIGLEELATLKGIATGIKEGEFTVDEAFSLNVKDDKAPKGKNVVGTTTLLKEAE